MYSVLRTTLSESLEYKGAFCPVRPSKGPCKSYAIRLIKSKLAANAGMLYDISAADAVAATAAVTKYLFPVASKVFLKASTIKTTFC